MVSRTVMIRCALESPYLGQPIKYLERHHITHKKFLEPPEVKKCAPKTDENTEISGVSVGSEKQDFDFCAFSET